MSSPPPPPPPPQTPAVVVPGARRDAGVHVRVPQLRGAEVGPGLKKPLGTGPVTAVTSLTGPARFRFRAVQTGAKFKF